MLVPSVTRFFGQLVGAHLLVRWLMAAAPAVAVSASTPVSAQAAAATTAKDEETLRSGRFVFPDGSTYEGQYIAAVDSKPQKHGVGVFTSAHMTYSGGFDHDSMHGHGAWVGAAGSKYTGEFARNQFSGQGAYRWKDGAHYAGSWSLGRMHGVGCYTSKEGTSWRGEFHNGLYFSGKAHVALR